MKRALTTLVLATIVLTPQLSQAEEHIITANPNLTFSPEFLGRLDETIVFAELDIAAARKIAQRQLVGRILVGVEQADGDGEGQRAARVLGLAPGLSDRVEADERREEDRGRGHQQREAPDQVQHDEGEVAAAPSRAAPPTLEEAARLFGLPPTAVARMRGGK